MQLADRVALVTGGGGAIGAACALAFAREGAHVALVDLNEEAAEAVAARVRALGRQALAIRADVRQRQEIEEAVARTVAAFGSLDIMHNNAGLNVQSRSVETSEETWDLIVDTDLKGVFFGCQAAARVMLPRGRGVILNTASVAGLGGMSRRGPYTAAKAGVINLTRTLACEWGLAGIRVCAIAPGWVLTPRLEEAGRRGTPDLDQVRRRTPMGRLGTPEDIAGAAVFLASDAAAWITGITLPVDGGFTAYGAPEPVPSW